MYQDELEQVENPAIAQLQQLDWTFIPGAQLTPEQGERASLRDVILTDRLSTAIQRINPWISDENLRKVARRVTHPNHIALMEYNQSLWNLLFGEKCSEPQDLGNGRQDQTVTIIDCENPANNEYICTSQFRVLGQVKHIIPDIVCFVNGIPLAVIECKSPYITSPMDNGIDQLRYYANIRGFDEEGAQRLFWTNQLMISTCRDDARVGTISAAARYYGFWKDAYPYSDDEVLALLANTKQPTPGIKDTGRQPLDYHADTTTAQTADVGGKLNPQQRLLAGMFNREGFLDLMQNFILFEVDDGKLLKKVARYQQYRAVNKVIAQLKHGKTRRDKSGVIWHTQGSGKSLTMVMLAVKMRRDPELQKYKLVFVTDRTQLDGQLSSTFANAQSETVKKAGSVAELKELLQTDTSDLITTTVQKFADMEKEDAEGFADLNTSEHIIVLADEAHRTQFGGLAMTINAALPNAPKIGFTGTPLLKTHKMDQAFGGYIDKYKINEAVDDGATVRILYEGRQALVEVAGESLDSLFDEYFAEYTDDEKREIKKKYGVEKAVREAPARVRRVCIDLLKHYREHILPDGFKAMIVVGSRHAATVYKDELDKLGAPDSEVIISGSQNDLPYIAKHTNSAHHKEVIKEFKRPLTENPVAFLIVKDMLLTGFDAPIAQVMYIDRSLKEHTLMQAIARVNRTYAGKETGFIVDYYGLSDSLAEALELFSSDDVEGTYHSLKDELPKLQAAHTKAMAFFTGIDLTERDGLTVDACVLSLKDEEKRGRFDIAFTRFAKLMNVILPDKAAAPYLPDLRFLGKVQNACRLKYREQGMSLADAGAKVRQLLDDHILSTGVDPRIPPVDLMAANFREKVNEIKSPESRAAEIESALKAHITVNLDEDPEFYKSLSLRLRDIIEKNAGKWEQQELLLLEMMEDIKQDRGEVAKELGLSEIELPFYNIMLAEVAGNDGEQVVDQSTLDAIRDTTKALVQMFDEASTIVDLFSKPDQIKTMKKEIKRTVIDQPFGNAQVVKTLQERFIELARTKYRG